MEERNPNYERYCNKCGKAEAQLGEGQKFKQCAKCSTELGMKVLYCDKECQLSDWTSGIPPHKAICGRKFRPITTFPEPDPGFTWSRYLKTLVKHLRDDPQLSYVLARPSPQPDVGIMFPNEVDAKRFELAKAKAMRNGDIGSVCLMWDILTPIAKDFGVSQQAVEEQLRLEYSIPKGQLAIFSAQRAADRIREMVEQSHV